MKHERSHYLYQILTYLGLFCALLYPVWGFSGGGWTSSGGSGVVCFKNPEIAKKADSFIDKNKPLNSELLSQIESIESYDLFEADSETKARIIKEWGSTDSTIQPVWPLLYDKIVDRIRSLSPIFGFTLKILHKKMDISHWKDVTALNRISDQFNSGDPRNIGFEKQFSGAYPHCRLIQIIRRVSKANSLTVSEAKDFLPLTGRYLDFKIEYVSELFDRMNSLNKVLIYLHEQLYLLGTPLGHLSSFDVRYWVREFSLLLPQNIFLSEKTPFLPAGENLFDGNCREIESQKNTNPVSSKIEKELDSISREVFKIKHCYKPPTSIRQRLTMAFGDYALYFFKEKDFQREISKSENPFYSVFMNTLLEFREKLHHCMSKEKDPKSQLKLKLECHNKIVLEFFSKKNLTGPENILLLTWFVYEKRDQAFNFEYLVNPDPSPKSMIQLGAALDEICSKILLDATDPLPINEMIGSNFERGLRMCEKILKLLNPRE